MRTKTPNGVVPTPRMSLSTMTSDVYRALVAFTQAAEEKLDPVVAELVKIRASQMNGCAFCIDMHTKNARAAGESELRLSALPAWRETPLFTDRERAALALTEAVTFVASARVSDEVYEAAARQFNETELAHLLWTLAAINAWNRIGVSTGMMPGCYEPVAR